MSIRKKKKSIFADEERIVFIKKKKQSPLDIRVNFLTTAKQLKVIGLLVFFLSLPLAASLVSSMTQAPVAMYPVESVVKSPLPVSREEMDCRFGGGEWKQLPNSCGDICNQENKICNPVYTPACDCGQYDCWNGEECVLNPVVEAKPVAGASSSVQTAP
ncbi:hypothetical protein A2160_05075 [Candidatus Beckwithbacteria bacterium RBG_13_42_9]|uniref:Uncharacterized protein n=1 Tax=Candidatus Beckwithbacteria bacterium RBG_13_42_9 TaxID=1797457 RepID=A0A1F5E6R5_9BACT|nr:MAG: hypothetical protein A2160_05075 [Candidatus Beckwithbacteria bacterium RBG_13_42_9]